MDLPVHLALESQIGSLQTKAMKGADIIHGEAGPVWQGRVTSVVHVTPGWHGWLVHR